MSDIKIKGLLQGIGGEGKDLKSTLVRMIGEYEAYNGQEIGERIEELVELMEDSRAVIES